MGKTFSANRFFIIRLATAVFATICFPEPAYATAELPVIATSALTKVRAIGDSIEYIVARRDSVDANQSPDRPLLNWLNIHEPQHRWIRSKSTRLSFFWPDAEHWMRIALRNDQQNDYDGILHAGLAFLSEAEMRCNIGGSKIIQSSGNRTALADKAVKQPRTAFRIQIPAGQVALCHFRFVFKAAPPILVMHLEPYSTQVASSEAESAVLVAIAGTILAMFIYNLLVYISSRDVVYLYYCLYVGSYFAFYLTISIGSLYVWPNSTVLPDFLYPILYNVFIIFAWLFGATFLRVKEIRKFQTIVKFFVASQVLMTALSFFAVQLPWLSVIQSPWAGVNAIVVLGIGIERAFKTQEGKLFLMGWSQFLIGSIITILTIQGVLEYRFWGYYATAFGSAMELMFFSFALANKLNTMRMKLQYLNENLEEKVVQRTVELSEALDSVKRLKTQQDGDYFLTSLLIEPLIKGELDNEYVKVKSFVRQYKHFEFRHRRGELGGDIVLADRIELQGKFYTVAVNGDAMGKSMQGAGGVLVIGSIFAAIIERNRFAGENRQQRPEVWIRHAFMELQRVFVQFQGAMLISISLILLEESTGFLYYVNAEHPHAVLLRGKKATFIENSETVYRKIGTPDISGKIMVKRRRLQPGDVVILGSDGKDDILRQIDGHEIMNADEHLFLQVVEEVGSEPVDIFRRLEETGKITDDLSILCLEYKGCRQPA